MNRTLQLTVKRVVDVVVALGGLLVLSPVLTLIAIAIKGESRGPVLFRQERTGLQGRRFHVFKFRTMREAYDRFGKPLPDAERLTALGRFLRKSSLDELPQLINVLRGEMSLVGPRPLLPEYLDRYTPEQNRRHQVKPGITGWVQVRGRNSLSWEKKFELDVWYVDHQSLWLDLKILFLTVEYVLKRKGINQPGHATVEFFQGSPRDTG